MGREEEKSRRKNRGIEEKNFGIKKRKREDRRNYKERSGERKREGYSREDRRNTGKKNKKIGIKRKEREERRSNIIVRSVEMGEGGKKETLRKKLMENIGVVVKVERARIIGRKDRKGRVVVWAKLGGVEDKKKVIREKRMLAGTKERVEDDLTWGERKAA